MSGDIVKTLDNRRDAEAWLMTLQARDKYLKDYKIVVWHGESRALFYIVEI